jgi:solute:Na+ symporter, SSS family
VNLELAGILGYVALQLVVGVAVSRRITSEASYLLAGRSLGYGLAGFSIFATWLGAETCIGSAGSVYSDGVNATTVEPFAYAACLLVMGALFAAPLWRRGYTTVADLFRSRYSPGVERLVVLLVVPTSLLWAAAQLRAFGQVLSASSELPLATAMGVATGVAVIYTTFGGLLADAVTDVVQGVLLAAGLVLLGVLLWLAPELSEATPPVSAAGAALSSLSAGEATGGASWLEVVEAWSVPIFGSLLAQELVSRVLGSRSAKVAVRAALAGGAAYLVIGLIPVYAGLAGARLMPGLEDPEQLLLLLARDLLTPLPYVLFAGALVSAILSTVDSTLLAASSLTSHNLIVSLRPDLPDAARLRLARSGVVLFGGISYGIALNSGGVLELVEQASSFASAGVFVAGCFGLFSRLGGPASASAALIAGAAAWLASETGGLATPYLVSLASALIAYLGVALVEHRTGTEQAPGRAQRAEGERSPLALER